MLLKLDCWLRGLWRKIRYRANVNGCNLVEEELLMNVTVSVCKCQHCGKYEITWYGQHDTKPTNYEEVLSRGIYPIISKEGD